MSKKTTLNMKKIYFTNPNNKFSKKNIHKIIFESIFINIAFIFRRVASKVFVFVKVINNMPILGSMM